MCRLIAAFSLTNLDPTYFFANASQSLLRQSDIDPRRKQGDGWGLGFFDRGRSRVIKSAGAMYREGTQVRRAARAAHGKTLVGHVRWASNPLRLKHDALIGPVHSQPFEHRGWIFAHNGTLFIPKEVAAQLGPWKQYIRGRNDSEVLCYWIMKHLTHAKNPVSAVRNALKGIHRVWDRCKRSYPIHRYPYHGLNWVLTNGKMLLAFCYTDPSGFGKSKALCDRRDIYYQLRRKITPEGVVVASEPLDRDPGWKGFQHGELLIAKRQGKRLSVRTVKVL